MPQEKKEKANHEKGDKGTAGPRKAKNEAANPTPQAGSGRRGGHRRRTGGNPDASG